MCRGNALVLPFSFGRVVKIYSTFRMRKSRLFGASLLRDLIVMKLVWFAISLDSCDLRLSHIYRILIMELHNKKREKYEAPNLT